MADPIFVNSGSNANAYLTNSGRTCSITSSGVPPAAGVAANGVCDANVDFSSGKVVVCVQQHVLSNSNGTTPVGNKGPRIGLVNSDWALLANTTAAARPGESVDSWGIDGSSDPASALAETVTVATAALAVGDGEYTLAAFDPATGKSWLGRGTSGSPGSVTWVTPDGGSAGSPAAGTDPTFTVSGTGVKLVIAGATTFICGATILTAEEFSALNITLPTGFSYATDGASSGPDVPTSFAIEQGTGAQLSATWNSGSGDSIEIEVSATEGGFTGTPTTTDIADDGGPELLSVVGAGTWWAKIRRVVDSVASDWSSAVSAVVTIDATLSLRVKNPTTKTAPCGIVASIVESTPPTGAMLSTTTATWRWYLDDVLQETLRDSLTCDIALTDGSGGDVKIEVDWYAEDGSLLGSDETTVTVAPEPTYDIVRYINPSAGADSNDGLTAETAKASFSSIVAGLDMTADHERVIYCAGSGITNEGDGVTEIDLGYADGSWIVYGNGDVVAGAAWKMQQHAAGNPSRHIRLAFVDMPALQKIANDDIGCFKMSIYPGSDASRARGYDLLWTGAYAGTPDIATPVTRPTFEFTRVGYTGSPSDYESSTQDWEGLGDAVVHLGSLGSTTSNAWYGEMEWCGLRVDEVKTTGSHSIRSPRSKAAVIRPRSTSRIRFRPCGSTGDMNLKLPARAADGTGDLAGRLDTLGICVVDADFEAQDTGGISVAAVAVGPVNTSEESFTRCVRLVRPRHVVADGSTPGTNRNLLFAYAGCDDIAIFDPIIEHPYSSILRLGDERLAAAVAEPGDASLHLHRIAVIGGSMRKEDSGGAIVRHGGVNDMTGHTWALRLFDIAADCPDAGAVGIQVQDSDATVTIETDGLVTQAATFAEDDTNGLMTLAQFGTNYGVGARNLNVDPEFTDAEGGNFSFAEDSPLYEAGGDKGLSVDFFGTERTSPRDIGAVEVSVEDLPEPTYPDFVSIVAIPWFLRR